MFSAQKSVVDVVYISHHRGEGVIIHAIHLSADFGMSVSVTSKLLNPPPYHQILVTPLQKEIGRNKHFGQLSSLLSCTHRSRVVDWSETTSWVMPISMRPIDVQQTCDRDMLPLSSQYCTQSPTTFVYSATLRVV